MVNIIFKTIFMMFFANKACPSGAGVMVNFYNLTPSESGGDIFTTDNAIIVKNLKYVLKESDLTSNGAIDTLKRKVLEVFPDKLIKLYLISGFGRDGSVKNYIEKADGNDVSELTTEISDSSENKVKELIKNSIYCTISKPNVIVNVYFRQYEKDKQPKKIPNSGKKIVKISKGCCSCRS